MIKLIVGLGNPGKKYEKTRHNVGFMVLDKLREMFDADNFSFIKKLSGDIVDVNENISKNTKFVLLKPEAFMNNSGKSVSTVLKFRNIDISQLVVIHDEMDIPFGEIRFNFGKSSAGHNGVQSIISALGDQDFWRLRIGILSSEKGQKNTETFVLERFSAEEEKILPEVIDKAIDKLKETNII